MKFRQAIRARVAVKLLFLCFLSCSPEREWYELVTTSRVTGTIGGRTPELMATSLGGSQGKRAHDLSASLISWQNPSILEPLITGPLSVDPAVCWGQGAGLLGRLKASCRSSELFLNKMSKIMVVGNQLRKVVVFLIKHTLKIKSEGRNERKTWSTKENRVGRSGAHL